jgi:lipopolysaccharide/colanic/teichoic acid biosynthesis glycosyltransferase
MRRAIDLVGALGVGLIVLPLVGVVALIVRLRLGRPVLFRQTRSGLRGREFTITKFRTMRAERFPGEPDPDRIGALGRVLRASSLDELPQLWNVLRGEMSFVGPRPTLPEQVRCYDDRQRRRLEVLPGITGWAQVHGRNSLSWPERIELDIWYVEHRSLWLDLRIVFRTVLALLRPHGVTAPGGINPGFPAAPGEAEPGTDVPRTWNTAEG